MWHLTKWALRSRLATYLMALVIAGASVWAFLGLKIELFPDISFPYTTVVTIYPQATADAVVSNVTEPIEKFIWDEWSGTSLKHVTSKSTAGMSLIMAEFEYGTDMTAVTERLNKGIGEITLPEAVLSFPDLIGSDTSNPQIIPINMNMIPMTELSVSGNLPPEQLKEIVDKQIVPALTQIDGVLRVDTDGGESDQVIISGNPDKMNAAGVSVAQITGLLNNRYSSLSEVENTSLGTNGITLADVATVRFSAPPSAAIIRTDGKPSVSISITKTETANTVETAEAINAKIMELQNQLGSNVTINTVFDQSDFINASVSQLWEKALIGAGLAILVVFFFLWAVRASLITAISIPLSVFIGFLCMRLTGVTLNLLTLSAVTIAIGRLIDDSIVMIEIIFRRMRRGEDFKEASIGGAKEIATPITAATLATVAIFIPLMFVGGIVGELFIPFGLTVTFTMLASLLVALTLIPTLSRFLVSSKAKAVTVRDNWYQIIYSKALKWTLEHSVTVIVAAVILLLGSIGLLLITGTSFMSGSMSEPTLNVNITLPISADAGEVDTLTAKVEKLLSENPAIRTFQTTVGTSTTSMSGIMSTAMGSGGTNTASIVAYLKDDADIQAEVEALNYACRSITDTGSVTVSGADSETGMGFSVSSLNISIQGEDQAKIAKVTAQLLEKLQQVDGIADLKSDLTTVVPKLNITVDPAKAMTSGLPMTQLTQLQQEFVLLMYGGTIPGKTVTLDNEDFSFYFMSIVPTLTSVDQAKNLKIGYPQSVTLNDLAVVTMEELPSHISHTDTTLSATITGTIIKKDVGAVNQAIEDEIESLPDRSGVTIVTAGVMEEMTNTFNRMYIAIIIAIIIVFAIVILMMRSFRNPLIIMISLPLAFIGSITALLISGYTLGVSAMMGLLMLVGIVLTNAIVLVSMVEQQRKNGMEIKDALIEGGKIRLRPILMTALTTILAMIPMAVSVSTGTMLTAELAIVVIGGMVSSTFLTLFVIPAVYNLVHRKKTRPAAK